MPGMRRVTLVDPLTGRETYAFVRDMDAVPAEISRRMFWAQINDRSRQLAMFARWDREETAR